MKRIISMIICMAFVFSSIGIYSAPIVANAEETAPAVTVGETKDTIIVDEIEYQVTLDSKGNVVAIEPANTSVQQTTGISAYRGIDPIRNREVYENKKDDDQELKEIKDDYKKYRKEINDDWYYPASKVGSRLKTMKYYDHFAAYLVKENKSTDDVYIRLDNPITTTTAAERLDNEKYKDVWSVSADDAKDVAKRKSASGQKPKGAEIHNKDKYGNIKEGNFYRHYHYVNSKGKQQGGHSFYYDKD